jgi:transposase
VRWRSAEDWPPAPWRSSSPDDPEARAGNTRETEGTGDTVHVPATWDDETPHLITDVMTPPATTSAFARLPALQAHLATRQLTPGEQLVDAGSVTSDQLLTRRTAHGIALVGPVPADQSGQGPAKHGCAAANVVIDGEAHHAICPQGQRSVVWTERPARQGHATVRLAVSQPVWAAWASRAEGTRAARAPRARRMREHDHDTVLQAARAPPQTATCTQVYARRAGIAGTMAQGTRMGDLRRSRAIGVVPPRRRPLRVATALHFTRVAAWLAAIPRAQTRPAAVAALAAAE